MSEREAYRVRQSVYLGDDHFTAKNDGHPYLALPWPEDCPWDIEDFPLPGTVVVNNRGHAITVVGPPRLDGDGDWMMPVQYGECVDWWMVKDIPSIWNARKDAKDERVVGAVRSKPDGTWTITTFDEIRPGVTHDIIRREEP